MDVITLEKDLTAVLTLAKLAAAISTSLQPIVHVKRSVNDLMPSSRYLYRLYPA